MTVPVQIATDIGALIASITAFQPLESASQLQIVELQVQCSAVLLEIDTALDNAAGNLDNGDPNGGGFAGNLPQDLLLLATASDDQSSLCDMRGLVGRALFNLTQARTS